VSSAHAMTLVTQRCVQGGAHEGLGAMFAFPFSVELHLTVFWMVDSVPMQRRRPARVAGQAACTCSDNGRPGGTALGRIWHQWSAGAGVVRRSRTWHASDAAGFEGQDGPSQATCLNKHPSPKH
jgi:hypothetical protein